MKVKVRNAWNAPGVVTVDNELLVGYHYSLDSKKESGRRVTPAFNIDIN
jgi:hypothetical protein